MINTSTEERGRQLLSIARGALTEKLLGEKPPIPNAAWLQKPGAAFVTLRTRNRLRGCIGTVIPYRSLLDDVRQNAVAAATRDGRFSPLQRRELESLTSTVPEALVNLAIAADSQANHKSALAYLRRIPTPARSPTTDEWLRWKELLHGAR